jgi:hypothetical protein
MHTFVLTLYVTLITFSFREAFQQAHVRIFVVDLSSKKSIQVVRFVFTLLFDYLNCN